MVSKSYVFDMVNINDYLDDIYLKDSYTVEELKGLEPKLRESILIMNESKSKRRVYEK